MAGSRIVVSCHNLSPYSAIFFLFQVAISLHLQVRKNIEEKTHQHIDARSKARYLCLPFISILTFGVLIIL